MKTIYSSALMAVVAGSAAIANVEPIRGSITYDQAEVHAEVAPVGTRFFHSFTDADGRDVREIYRVNPDRSVTLVGRTLSNEY